MSKMTRREFTASALAAAATGGAAALLAACQTTKGYRPQTPASTWSKVIGANEDVRVAVVGFHSKGKTHIDGFRKMKGVRVVALCDVDSKVLDKEVKKFTDRNEKVAAYRDIRELLDDPNVDAVVTATPNHWHALVTVWACQAGKDVYVEKPACHEIWEGIKQVEAARKYKRVVQVGTQHHSDQGLKEAFEWIHAGNLGKILVARGLCYKPRESIGKVSGPQPIPPEIDYNLWAGPAPMVPLMRKRLHYDWHWFWLTGNGDIGNQGIHEMDLARWALGATETSPRTISIGGRFGYDDDGQTPNTHIVFQDYKPAPLIFEVRGLPVKAGSKVMPAYKGIRIGNVIHCEGGYFAGGWAYDNKGEKIKQFKLDGGKAHRSNFIEAVRSRKWETLNSDIQQGHLSATLVHSGNISHRLGKEASQGEIMEKIKAEKDAVETFERLKEHLAANEIDLDKSKATLGPWLAMDTKQLVFTGPFAAEANKLRKRDYRKPFEIPEQV